MEILVALLGVAPALTYLYMASLGNTVVERSGILNLAIDGAFAFGSSIAYAYLVQLLNPVYSAVATMLTIAALGLLIAVATTWLPLSHGAVGLSLMLILYGLASYIGYPAALSERGSKIPAYTNDLVVNIALLATVALLALAINYIIYRTKLGATIRAVGEDPNAASILGISVLRTRILASLIGYSLIGLGSALYIFLDIRTWQEGSGVGVGWIAMSISLAGGRHPLASVLVALVFSYIIQYRYVLIGYLGVYGITVYAFNALQYVIAIVSMIIFSATPLKRIFAQPKALGKPFFREERSV